MSVRPIPPHVSLWVVCWQTNHQLVWAESAANAERRFHIRAFWPDMLETELLWRENRAQKLGVIRHDVTVRAATRDDLARFVRSGVKVDERMRAWIEAL